MKEIKFIGFTGHRDAICKVEDLAQIHEDYPDAIWIHGGAIGFDMFVDKYARSHGLSPIIETPRKTQCL